MMANSVATAERIGHCCGTIQLLAISVMVFLTGEVLVEEIPLGPTVVTSPHVSLQMGTMGFLPCHVTGTPFLVQWIKGRRRRNESRPVLHIYKYHGSDRKYGSGYVNGRFDMTNNYSLVINSVRQHDEDHYICLMVGSRFASDVTNVTVYVTTPEPFPIINECYKDRQAEQNCTLIVEDEHIAQNITCLVNGSLPMSTLHFGYKSRKVVALDQIQWENRDKTYGTSLTISTKVGSDEDYYQCVASGRSVFGEMIQRSATIYVRRRLTMSPQSDTRKEMLIIVAMIFVSTLCLLAAWFRVFVPSKSRRAEASSPPNDAKIYQETLKLYYVWECEELKTSPLDPDSRRRSV